MPVKEGGDQVVAVPDIADLVMPADAGEFLVRAPVDAIGARLPIQFATVGVFSEQIEKSESGNVARLRVGHLVLPDEIKISDTVRLTAAEFPTGPGGGASAHKNPDVSLVINRQGGIVVRIVDGEFIEH